MTCSALLADIAQEGSLGIVQQTLVNRHGARIVGPLDALVNLKLLLAYTEQMNDRTRTTYVTSTMWGIYPRGYR